MMTMMTIGVGRQSPSRRPTSVASCRCSSRKFRRRNRRRKPRRLRGDAVAAAFPLPASASATRPPSSAAATRLHKNIEPIKKQIK